MPFVGAGAPLHDAYVQRLPLLELWWRLLEPYKLPECPSHVVVSLTLANTSTSNATTVQASRVGVYEKTELVVDHHPVYRKVAVGEDKDKDNNNLFFSVKGDNNWMIGPDVMGLARGIQSSSQDAAFCPNLASGWLTAEDSKGNWQAGKINVEVKWCGVEGPKLIWEPVVRACGENKQEVAITSTLSECSMRGTEEMNSLSGMSHMGSFWTDGAERGSTQWTFDYESPDGLRPTGLRNNGKWYTQEDTLQPTMHTGTQKGMLDTEMANDMAENAEAQIHAFRQCRDHPDFYDGHPLTKQITGGGFTANNEAGLGAPRCVEIQQMRGRCEGSSEFDFEYYRTCYGTLNQPETSWLCTRAADVPGGLTVESVPLRIAPDASLLGLGAVGVAALALIAAKLTRRRASTTANLV